MGNDSPTMKAGNPTESVPKQQGEEGGRRIGYWRIARAGSYKGCIRASLDSPPLRRYDAAGGQAEILELILETAL